jgi:hypothetical protein
MMRALVVSVALVLSACVERVPEPSKVDSSATCASAEARLKALGCRWQGSDWLKLCERLEAEGISFACLASAESCAQAESTTPATAQGACHAR